MLRNNISLHGSQELFKGVIALAISPFSLEHDWAIHWTRLPSNMQERPILGQIAENEEQALKAIASVGLITSNQLLDIYSLGSKKLKRMVMRNRIVRHELVMNGKHRISVYSLGINGAKIAGVVGYENNYWLNYRINDILKRLIFFKFYERVNSKGVFPAPDPFIGALVINDKPMYVYVVRGDLNDISMYLKWNAFNERLIIITESLSFLEQLKPYLHNLKLRVILDEGVVNHEQRLNNVFYLLEENQFIKEGG